MAYSDEDILEQRLYIKVPNREDDSTLAEFSNWADRAKQQINEAPQHVELKLDSGSNLDIVNQLLYDGEHFGELDLEFVDSEELVTPQRWKVPPSKQLFVFSPEEGHMLELSSAQSTMLENVCLIGVNMSYDHVEDSWKNLKNLTYSDDLSAEVLKSSTNNLENLDILSANNLELENLHFNNLQNLQLFGSISLLKKLSTPNLKRLTLVHCIFDGTEPEIPKISDLHLSGCELKAFNLPTTINQLRLQNVVIPDFSKVDLHVENLKHLKVFAQTEDSKRVYFHIYDEIVNKGKGASLKQLEILNFSMTLTSGDLSWPTARQIRDIFEAVSIAGGYLERLALSFAYYETEEDRDWLYYNEAVVWYKGAWR